MRTLAGGILALAVVGGVWIAQREENAPRASGKGEVVRAEHGKRFGGSLKGEREGKQVGKRKKGKERESGKGLREDSASEALAAIAEVTDGPRPPLQLMGLLATGKPTVNERVRQLRGLRGKSFAEEDRERALAFLSGNDWPEGIGKGSMHWLGDELLTALRLQDPPWDGLAAALGEVAFQPTTDPVLRDYIMQHLGHYWEQYGSRKEIDQALWRAVGSSDTTTPGTALIALSRGYQRDQQQAQLENVQQRAFELARDPATPLAVRVTALSIAGDGPNKDVKQLAQNLAQTKETPVILRTVAERVLR
jgi:hypothetical protein